MSRGEIRSVEWDMSKAVAKLAADADISFPATCSGRHIEIVLQEVERVCNCCIEVYDAHSGDQLAETVIQRADEVTLGDCIGDEVRAALLAA